MITGILIGAFCFAIVALAAIASCCVFKKDMPYTRIQWFIGIITSSILGRFILLFLVPGLLLLTTHNWIQRKFGTEGIELKVEK